MEYKSLQKLGLGPKHKERKSFLIGLLNKILLCTLICLISLILMKKNENFRDFVNDKVFGNNISFAYFNDIYNKYLGDLFPNKKSSITPVFNEEFAYYEVSNYYDGVMLKVENNYLVPVLGSGIVIFMGEIDHYGKVIIIEQVDGVNVWYGNVNTNNVKLYDYVDEGSFLGEAIDDKLYIVLEKEGKYIDFETYQS